MSAKKSTDPFIGLQQSRARVAALKAERARVDDAPVPVDEARARIVLHIERLAADWRAAADIGHFTTSTHDGPLRQGPAFDDKTMNPPAAVLAPDALAAELFRAAEAHIEARGGAGLPSHERREALARLDAEILAAEIAEEEAVCAAERAGLAVQRRGDADPAAVLSVAA